MKRKVSLLLVVLLIVGSLPFVFANNNSDTFFGFGNAESFHWYHTGGRSKTDDSPVYLYMQNTPDNATITVHAERLKWGYFWENENYYSEDVYVYEGYKYSIHTLIYENGGRTARLSFNSDRKGTMSGLWSPDSTGHYNDI